MVAYDGGADRVTGYADVTPDNVGALVDGTIFTRGGKDKQNTAIFVGGGDMAKGEALFEAVKKKFFGPFRVSVMLDSNGSNTTAAAGVALLAKAKKLKGKKAVVLAGTGPVGMRAAAFLGQEGADVTITSRTKERAEAAAKAIEARFGVKVKGVAAPMTPRAREAVKDANIVFAAGAIGAQLLPAVRLAVTTRISSCWPTSTPSRRSASRASRRPTRARTATASLPSARSASAASN